MIKGQVKQDATVRYEQPKTDYRKIVKINQSALKTYDNNPRQFYKEFILGEKREEKLTYSLMLGSIVDFIMLECNADFQEFEQRLDEQFYLYEGIRGDGQMFDLADKLYDFTMRDTIDGEITSTFLARFSEAFDYVQGLGKFKGKEVSKVVDIFVGSKEEEYFKSKMEAVGKMVIDTRLLEKAKQISEKVLNDEKVGPLFKYTEDYGFNVYNHLVIEWEYETLFGNKIECKQEVDKLDVDHRNKTVQPYDTKAVYDSEGFAYSYLKYGYYVQQCFYSLGILQWMDKQGIGDYALLPFNFIVIDTSSDNLKPLIFETTEQDFLRALDGFSINGRKYAGVRGLFEEVNWAMENNIFDISKENFDNNQMVKLNLRYD